MSLEKKPLAVFSDRMRHSADTSTLCSVPSLPILLARFLLRRKLLQKDILIWRFILASEKELSAPRFASDLHYKGASTPSSNCFIGRAMRAGFQSPSRASLDRRPRTHGIRGLRLSVLYCHCTFEHATLFSPSRLFCMLRCARNVHAANASTELDERKLPLQHQYTSFYF